MTAAEVAVFHAAGSGRMLVTRDHHGCVTFTISGRTNSLTISDDEADQLAEALLEYQPATNSRRKHVGEKGNTNHE